MDRPQIDWHWFRNEPIAGAAFTLNHPVRVIGGELSGAMGSVIALLSLEPEARYLVELGSGSDVELCQTELRSAYSDHPRSALGELQHWYASQTDSDWEHSHGVRIATLDNPGRRLEIGLAGTQLEEHPFSEIKELDSEDDWIVCQVEAGRFVARGGPLMLNA